MVVFENEQPTYKEAREHFERLLDLFTNKKDILQTGIPTGNINSHDIEQTLFRVAQAVADGEDPQPAIDTAWAVFHEENPVT